MNRTEAIKLMTANGFSEMYATYEVDRYTAQPGQALGYMLGNLELKDIRRMAEEELGNLFTPRGFHESVLGSGSVSLQSVRENVKYWIQRTKKHINY